MKLHILIIDDDKDELTIFLEALKKIPLEDGFKCTYANSPEQAFEMLRYLVPDFIFVDQNMPHTDGFYFLRNIRNNENLRETKVFLYSTAITQEDIGRAIALGASDCVKKTNSVNDLTIILKLIFEHQYVHIHKR